jgi:G3E family GTPase
MVTGIDVTTVLDAGAFLADFARLAGHLQAQIIPAGTVIVNKADLVSPATLRLVADTVRTLAPFAAILPARFGITGEPILGAPPPPHLAAPPLHLVHDADMVAGRAHVAAPGDHHHDHAHGHHHHHDADHGAHHESGHDALGLASWSTALSGEWDADELQTVLEAVLQGEYGQVERIKGVTRAGAGWIKFDIAGGRSSMAAFAPSNADETPRVVAIGRHVDKEGLRAAFKACAA